MGEVAFEWNGLLSNWIVEELNFNSDFCILSGTGAQTHFFVEYNANHLVHTI